MLNNGRSGLLSGRQFFYLGDIGAVIWEIMIDQDYYLGENGQIIALSGRQWSVRTIIW